jgi:dolichol-phosphate mannosyltransferase
MANTHAALRALEAAGPHPANPCRPGAELSIIVPTLNESENIQVLYEAICQCLTGVDWEMIVVDDDSSDATVPIARELAARDHRVRCLRRIGRRGLSGAVIEGILSSSAFAIAVIDADLQHDERLLPRMLAELRGGADIAIGSRHVNGGSALQGFSRWRRFASESATSAARHFLGVQVTDPMSGFFAVRRTTAEAIVPRLSTQGFKVLLDLIVSAGEPLKIVELPYEFRPRHRGQSKLDSGVALDFFGLIVAKASGDRISARFLAFGLVGLTGLGVHLAALNAFLTNSNLSFDLAQVLAAVVAMTWNFSINNSFTYRDRRLSGVAWLWGLMTFYAVCGIGAIANVGVASWVYGNEPSWWLAGAAGAIMGAVFNYAVTASVTWRRT